MTSRRPQINLLHKYSLLGIPSQSSPNKPWSKPLIRALHTPTSTPLSRSLDHCSHGHRRLQLDGGFGTAGALRAAAAESVGGSWVWGLRSSYLLGLTKFLPPGAYEVLTSWGLRSSNPKDFDWSGLQIWPVLSGGCLEDSCSRSQGLPSTVTSALKRKWDLPGVYVRLV